MQLILIKHRIPRAFTNSGGEFLQAAVVVFVVALPLPAQAQEPEVIVPDIGAWDRPGNLQAASMPQVTLIAPTSAHTQLSRSYGQIFLRSWLPVTAAEFTLLGVTAMLPKDWTGWSPDFVRDGLNNLERAYTEPPVWDDDWWFHNYVGHPYGGSLYYNTVRCQGATPFQSMVFSAVLSTQWEYLFEAFAERPSIQDLVVTPVAGSILGELTHQLTLGLEQNGTSTGEKIIIFVINPMHVIFSGF